MRLHRCTPERISVVRLGKFDPAVLRNALLLANQIQQSFEFVYNLHGDIDLKDSYALPNGSYDLSKAVQDYLPTRVLGPGLRGPLIVSNEAMGDPENPNDPEWIYYSSQEIDYDPYAFVLSTSDRLLKKLRDCNLERYLLMMTGTYLAQTFGNLSIHTDTRGCPMDYCDDIADAQRFLDGGGLCAECERVLLQNVSLEQAASIIRILNRAARRLHCFVAMPFAEAMLPVLHSLEDALTGSPTGTEASGHPNFQWMVRRADQVDFPRVFTERAFKEIRTSDLVIADLTGCNSNVMYETGVAHALGRDLILISQSRQLPIDVQNVHCIFYDADRLDLLKKSVREAAKAIDLE